MNTATAMKKATTGLNVLNHAMMAWWTVQAKRRLFVKTLYIIDDDSMLNGARCSRDGVGSKEKAGRSHTPPHDLFYTFSALLLLFLLTTRSCILYLIVDQTCHDIFETLVAW